MFVEVVLAAEGGGCDDAVAMETEELVFVGATQATSFEVRRKSGVDWPEEMGVGPSDSGGRPPERYKI